MEWITTEKAYLRGITVLHVAYRKSIYELEGGDFTEVDPAVRTRLERVKINQSPQQVTVDKDDKDSDEPPAADAGDDAAIQREQNDFSLFSTLLKIIDLTERVVADFEHLGAKPYEKLVEMGQIVGRRYYAELINTYSSYCANYEQAQRALERRLAEEEGFAQLIEKLCSTVCEQRGIFDLLILPVQRLPRWKMFIDQILRIVVVESCEYKEIKYAGKCIDAVNSQVNQAVRTREQQFLDDQKQVNDLERRFAEPRLSLSRVGRCVASVSKHSCRLIPPPGSRDKVIDDTFTIVLFSDAVMIAQRDGSSGGLCLKAMWPLYKVVAREAKDSPTCFEIAAPEDFTLIAYCENNGETERNNWLDKQRRAVAYQRVHSPAFEKQHNRLSFEYDDNKILRGQWLAARFCRPFTEEERLSIVEREMRQFHESREGGQGEKKKSGMLRRIGF